MKSVKDQIDLLAKLLEKSNIENAHGTVGRCDWVDIEGNNRCNNFTEFQCQQAGGTFDADSRCDD